MHVHSRGFWLSTCSFQLHHTLCDACNIDIWPSGIGQVSPPIHPLTSSQGAVFLINSCQEYFRCGPHHTGYNYQWSILQFSINDRMNQFLNIETMEIIWKLRIVNWKLHCTQCDGGKPYPEVTAAFLPSSLGTNHSFALVYSTWTPVSVCGTVSFTL